MLKSATSRAMSSVTPGKVVSGTAPHFYDIGLNLTDPMFQGIYHGKQKHASDISNVLFRASECNVKSVLLTGSSFTESKDAMKLAQVWRDNSFALNLYYTVGVHPCCVNEFALQHQNQTIDRPSNDEEYNSQLHNSVSSDPATAVTNLRKLFDLIQLSMQNSQFRAIGEIGLDYDRLHYSSREMQQIFFEEQLKLSCLVNDDKKPLFLHMRSCAGDFIRILKKFIIGFLDHEDRFQLRDLVHEGDKDNAIFYKFNPDRKFVVHSFTDSLEDLSSLLQLSPNCYIGMNGASFRSSENIDCVREVPLDRLLLETDSPWCEMKRTHESAKYMDNADVSRYQSVKKEKLDKIPREEWNLYTVKGRNEPCHMASVAALVANVKKISLDEVIQTVWSTSCKVYGE
ncbi:3'-5'-exodeoxyribonuclease KNAG_0B02460 [Huiozyma naganishii CBS 8797]|uniref:TatD related DNase n=1 Tax=Huiozyma naganishii (strain ATCC MYA-139 / BCRC 22969 / CBS 8797 / KCTC 17520 / NBRC 10181 / NCYC 3082 / Yp74L-3) TaxID=1071383 RepID=J7RGL7_HUIN7|nr:hypothetical protein KNAG_0B02460 [Kazachstania naganishii CBS 8797]CCK68688.1 hypothetical protein KNAG_0B02460 [Kazachstania naganishii CBS 8797]